MKMAFSVEVNDISMLETIKSQDLKQKGLHLGNWSTPFSCSFWYKKKSGYCKIV